MSKNISVFSLMFAAICLGCSSNDKISTTFAPVNATLPTSNISYLELSADAQLELCESDSSIRTTASPLETIDYESAEYRLVSLDECIRSALEGSEVFRDLSGTIVSTPAGVSTALDPASTFTDPRFGEEAALSQFDANITTALNTFKNDRPFNNQFSGDSNGLFVQDLSQFSTEITKLSATGTQFTSRSGINYDANNQAGNRFTHSWETTLEGEFRHPLLQGSGSLFNRIAGPSQVPGVYNGVLIARTNTEISLTNFEASVRELISNVENAYWDLYFAYRELDAQIDARDSAGIVLRATAAEAAEDRIGAITKVSAEEQYLRFENSILASVEGRPVEGTQSGSGTPGGTFRRTVGVRLAERRLRFLIGMPITDGTLLQPSEQPLKAAVLFDWHEAIDSALARRPEVRRQRWLVKQRELELTAAKNFLMPRLDLVGGYRFRGLGKDLTGGGGTLGDDIANVDLPAFGGNSNAVDDLLSGNFQEIQMGAELRMPVGFRSAHAAVRNAELGVQRERIVMREQERKIMLDLSNSVAETRRAHSAMTLAQKRHLKAVEYRSQATALLERGRSNFDIVLEAQRRVLESQLQFINAEVEYALAIKNVHFEKGTYLDYSGVAMTESASSPKAYKDYERLRSSRQKELNYVMRDPTISHSRYTSYESDLAYPSAVEAGSSESYATANNATGSELQISDAVQGDGSMDNFASPANANFDGGHYPAAPPVPPAPPVPVEVQRISTSQQQSATSRRDRSKPAADGFQVSYDGAIEEYQASPLRFPVRQPTSTVSPEPTPLSQPNLGPTVDASFGDSVSLGDTESFGDSVSTSHNETAKISLNDASLSEPVQATFNDEADSIRFNFSAPDKK